MSKKAVQVLLSVPDLSTKAGRWDLALMIIIYSAAARIDEILSLKTGQLHLDAEKSNVRFFGSFNSILRRHKFFSLRQLNNDVVSIELSSMHVGKDMQ